MALHQTAIALADRYLADMLESGAWPKGSRLPSIRELARCAGVSTVTMGKALARLESAGTLYSIPRKGFYHGTPDSKSPQSTAAERTEHTVEYVRNELVRRILSGHYASMKLLPQYKELMAEFSVCHATIKAALNLLVKEELLERQRKRFAIRRFSRVAEKRTVVLLLGAEIFTRAVTISAYRSWLFPLIASLTNECAARNLSLTVRRVPNGTAQLALPDMVAGIIVWLDWSPGQSATAAWLLASLLHQARPVFLMDDDPVSLFGTLPVSENLFVFDDGNDRAGYAVGKYLLELGHTRVGYLGYTRSDAWSNKRYAGLVRAFEDAGYHDAVSEMYQFRQTASEQNPPQTKEADRTRGKLLHEMVQKINEGIDDSYLRDRALFALQELAQQSSRPVLAFLREYMEKLKKCSETAWVTDDTLMVPIVLPALKSVGRTIPAECSVVGISNTVEAFYTDCTSYDFNFSGLAPIIVSLFLYTKERKYLVAGGTTNIIRAPGYIVERATAGRCPPAGKI